MRAILGRTNELVGGEDADEPPGVPARAARAQGVRGARPLVPRAGLLLRGAGDWPHIGPVVETLLAEHDRDIAYLSSDAADPGLALDHPRLRGFLVGDGTARTILFARIDCAHFVMTLPDLDQLWLKRSQHPVHYVYLFHSMNSTHAAYREGAFDAYDTVLCVGPHHVAEIRATEARYGLPEKELVEHGSVKLDTVLAEVASRGTETTTGGARRVLVAPSWGECSLIERPVGTELVDVLLAAGLRDRPPPAPDDGPALAEARRGPPAPIRGAARVRPRGGHERSRLVAALGRDGQRLVGRGPRVRVRPRSTGRIRRHAAEDGERGLAGDRASVPFEDACATSSASSFPSTRSRRSRQRSRRRSRTRPALVSGRFACASARSSTSGRAPGGRRATSRHSRRRTRRRRRADDQRARDDTGCTSRRAPAALVPVAVRAPRRAVGLRGQPARVLDAEGEPRVPRRAWVDPSRRRRLRASPRICATTPASCSSRLSSGSSGHCSPARSTSPPCGASASSRSSSSSGCPSRSGPLRSSSRCCPQRLWPSHT